MTRGETKFVLWMALIVCVLTLFAVVNAAIFALFNAEPIVGVLLLGIGALIAYAMNHVLRNAD